MDREDAPRPADPGDLAPASRHEDLARGNDRDLCPSRKGAAAGVLQPEPQGFPLPDDGGEERRETNPRLRRRGGVKHELSAGALGVDSRGEDAHLRDPPVSAAAPLVAFGVDSFGAANVRVQGKREPWWWPLTPGS